MNADAWFAIGSPHVSSGTPCEDYALAGVDNGLGWAIISDGCSGAMARTDIGSRTLSMAARRAIASPADDWADLIKKDISVRNISDDPKDMFATMVMVASNETSLNFRVWGDGALLLRYKSGSQLLMEVNWADETPYYLQYSLMNGGIENFMAMHAENPEPVTMTITSTSADGDIEKMVNKFPIEKGMEGIGVHINPCGLILSATCFSDGISAIKGVSTAEATMAATAFKNHEGQFVARRMIRATRDWAKDGHLLMDDLSVASVFFGGES